MDNRLLEVVKAATVKTMSGGLEWRAFDDETFRTPVGTGYLHLRRGPVDAGQFSAAENFTVETYTVQVSDSQGRVVAEGTPDPRTDDVQACHELFEVARKSALKSNDVLDGILRVLRGPDVTQLAAKAKAFRRDHSVSTDSLIVFDGPQEWIFVGEDAQKAIDVIKNFVIKSGRNSQMAQRGSEYAQDGLAGDGTLRIHREDWDAISVLLGKSGIRVAVAAV